MGKILVVDDEPDLEVLIKQKFRQKIREGAYEFHFAANGREAFEKTKEIGDLDMVLSDINMPEVDGLTLLSMLKADKPLLKTVIVSAYGDMDNIRIAMNRGAFDFITKPINFEDLTLTIEKTLEQAKATQNTLKAIKENNILKMYVDENVLNFMNQREYENTLMVNESLNATVVFIDICRFTSISEKENADVVVKLLNRLFDIIVQEIIKQEGVVDKFIGDATMAVFKGDYHIDRAIEACLAVKEKIAQIPVNEHIAGFIPQISIGINSGEMISGNIGSSTLKRLDYTVIGDVVNTAQRLQAIAGPNQIMITDALYKQISESFQCMSCGEFKIKNKAEAVIAYEVIS